MKGSVIMKRLYINYELVQEIPSEILNDKNVYTSEIGFIVVKAEYKKKFEKKYNVPLTDFSEWFKNKYNQELKMCGLFYEITEDEPLLKNVRNERSFTSNYSLKMIESTLDKLYQMPDDKIIEYILNCKLEEVLKIAIKPFLMTEAIKKYQNYVRDLEAQYSVDYYQKITDI